MPHQHQGCLGECVPPPVPSRWHLPYLSRKRKKRVSTMVMRTPPQRGMLRDGKGGHWTCAPRQRGAMGEA